MDLQALSDHPALLPAIGGVAIVLLLLAIVGLKRRRRSIEIRTARRFSMRVLNDEQGQPIVGPIDARHAVELARQAVANAARVRPPNRLRGLRSGDDIAQDGRAHAWHVIFEAEDRTTTAVVTIRPGQVFDQPQLCYELDMIPVPPENQPPLSADFVNSPAAVRRLQRKGALIDPQTNQTGLAVRPGTRGQLEWVFEHDGKIYQTHFKKSVKMQGAAPSAPDSPQRQSDGRAATDLDRSTPGRQAGRAQRKKSESQDARETRTSDQNPSADSTVGGDSFDSHAPLSPTRDPAEAPPGKAEPES